MLNMGMDVNSTKGISFYIKTYSSYKSTVFVSVYAESYTSHGVTVQRLLISMRYIAPVEQTRPRSPFETLYL